MKAFRFSLLLVNIEKHYLYSNALGGMMPVAVYGHWGVPLLFFPTASADFEELERFTAAHKTAGKADDTNPENGGSEEKND